VCVCEEKNFVSDASEGFLQSPCGHVERLLWDLPAESNNKSGGGGKKSKKKKRIHGEYYTENWKKGTQRCSV